MLVCELGANYFILLRVPHHVHLGRSDFYTKVLSPFDSLFFPYSLVGSGFSPEIFEYLLVTCWDCLRSRARTSMDVHTGSRFQCSR